MACNVRGVVSRAEGLDWQRTSLRHPCRQAGTLFSSSPSLLDIDVVKVRKAGPFPKQTCEVLPNRGQVKSNLSGLLDSKLMVD